jgi:hypothetical protein
VLLEHFLFSTTKGEEQEGKNGNREGLSCRFCESLFLLFGLRVLRGETTLPDYFFVAVFN